MKLIRRELPAWMLGLGWGALMANAPLAQAAINPEQETLQVSKHLTPIPDEEWQKIAGDQLSQTYQIVSKDTLYDISKRLFGDSKYWPKVWALNNQRITNPHLILPGHSVVFMPGTGSTLPELALKTEGKITEPETHVAQNGGQPVSDAASEIPRRVGRSQDWRSLPKQPWESVQVILPATVDAQGFDRRNSVGYRKVFGFELDRIPASEPIEPLGIVLGGPAQNPRLYIRDQIHIDSAQKKLQIGETYTLTGAPIEINADGGTERFGYSYPNLGEVLITGINDEQYLGEIQSARDYIPRGAYVIPREPRVQNITPIPATSAVEGSVYLDVSHSTHFSSQHYLVFVNRGSDDGVHLGNVFRNYTHLDGATGEEITRSDVNPIADIVIVRTTPKLSVGIVTSGVRAFEDGVRVISLTDLSDLKRHLGAGTAPSPTGGAEKEDELDRLDRMGGGGNLGKDEENELKQLEDWKENPPARDSELDNLDQLGPTEPAPAAEPAPSSDLPPPPAEEGAMPPTAPPPATEPAPPEALPETPAQSSPPADSNAAPSTTDSELDNLLNN